MVEFEMVNDIRHCELENKKRIGQLRGGRDRGIYIDCVTWFAAGGIPTQNSMYAHALSVHAGHMAAVDPEFS